MSVRSITQWPSWLYQRYSRLWEHAILSAGWALLYVLCDVGVDAFPMQWRVVLAACIVIAGLWKPAVAYALFVAAVAYPLYLISIYVMALALAVLILSAPATVRFLPQALLILAAPLLAPIHLAAMLPLLAGLWWGEAAGALVGGLAALWLKLYAGMAGASPDLWQISGQTMDVNLLYGRFHAASSLQTLVRLVEPLAVDLDPLAPLFNLLQVFSWAAAGFAVGYLAHRLSVRTSRGWTAALSLGPGLVLIWAGYVAVPIWLRDGGIADVPIAMAGSRWFEPAWLPAQVVLASLAAWSIDALGRSLQQPVTAIRVEHKSAKPSFSLPIGRRKRTRLQNQAGESLDPAALLKKAKPSRQDREDQDIIMLELD